MTDMFKGDDAALIESINAAIELNRDGAMTPRIPTMAIELLTSAAIRLARATDDASLVKPGDLAWLERTKDAGHCGEGSMESKSRHDHNERIDRILAALAARGAGQGEADLSNPQVVHLNMLRGGIAKPTPAQIGHLYRGEEAVAVVEEVRRQNTEAFASPPVGEAGGWRPDREAVAQIIEPCVWDGDQGGTESWRALRANTRERALTKADQILALAPVPSQGEA